MRRDMWDMCVHRDMWGMCVHRETCGVCVCIERDDVKRCMEKGVGLMCEEVSPIYYETSLSVTQKFKTKLILLVCPSSCNNMYFYFIPRQYRIPQKDTQKEGQWIMFHLSPLHSTSCLLTPSQGIDVGKHVRDFHLRSYSSHHMTVAVISKGV